MTRFPRGVALAAVLALTACGGGGRGAAVPPGEWAGNVSTLLAQLQGDVVLAENGGSTVAAARRALASSSTLYTMVVAYTDFGGCARMLANAGPPARSGHGVQATIASACRVLQRAAALFTRATTRSDARALVAASRASLRAAPLLYRASAELGGGGQ